MTTFREIEFENNSPKVCYSGQLLKGRVNIYFHVDTHVKGEDLFLSTVAFIHQQPTTFVC